MRSTGLTEESKAKGHKDDQMYLDAGAEMTCNSGRVKVEKHCQQPKLEKEQ